MSIDVEMTDVLIHVHPHLEQDDRSSLEEELHQHDGVLSVHFNKEHEHLLMVEYNPNVISSERLLRLVGDRGIEASRIGL